MPRHKHRIALAIALALSAGQATSGCDRQGGSEAVYPKAEPYGEGPAFVGEWRGSVGGQLGVLHLGELSPRRYFANFATDDGRVQLALLLDQSLVSSGAGAALPSNRLLFTWQDGDGQRGHGWLKVVGGGAELSGASGLFESITGSDWAFSRADSSVPSQG